MNLKSYSVNKKKTSAPFEYFQPNKQAISHYTVWWFNLANLWWEQSLKSKLAKLFCLLLNV